MNSVNGQQVLPFARPMDDVMETILRRLPNTDFLKVSDISTAMDIDSELVRTWIDDGRLPAMNFGAGHKQAFYKVTRTGFVEFLQKRKDGFI